MTISTPNDDVGPIGAEVDEFLAPASNPAPPPPPSRSDDEDAQEDDGQEEDAEGEDNRASALRTTMLRASDHPIADVTADALARVPRTFPPALKSWLRGDWLGHPMHPALTDFPLGCWMCASVLDVVGGRSARHAATRLIALGLLGVPVAAAAGLVDWEPIDPEGERRARRVGATHATANVVAAGCYFVSWRARRNAHHAVGVVSALLGAAVTLYSGYLGGELIFGVPETDR